MPMMVLQATGVVVSGRAMLIQGPPGSGKSSLALALIDRGAVLLGDDGVVVDRHGDTLFARPHPKTRGLIEVRNLGLIEMPVCDRAAIALLIDLDEDAPRFIDSAEAATIAGVRIPMIRLWPGSEAITLKAELAMQLYGRAADGPD